MKKKVKLTNIEAVKSGKEIMDEMVADISGSSSQMTALKGEIADLNRQISYLQGLLKVKDSKDGDKKPVEEQIIMTELNRMYDLHVIRNCPIVEKDDIKKLETLVKCIVSLRAGKVPVKKKEKSMSIEDAMTIVEEYIK